MARLGLRQRVGDVPAPDDPLVLVQAIEHAPVETQIALAVPEPDGRLTIYSCTQALYFSLGVLSAHLAVPLNKIKIVGGTVGGGSDNQAGSDDDLHLLETRPHVGTDQSVAFSDRELRQKTLIAVKVCPRRLGCVPQCRRTDNRR